MRSFREDFLTSHMIRNEEFLARITTRKSHMSGLLHVSMLIWSCKQIEGHTILQTHPFGNIIVTNRQGRPRKRPKVTLLVAFLHCI